MCLLKPARPDVLQHVITLAAMQAPQYLNLPDALGRTPLWVAIENQDQASVQLLLKAGADPLQACKFSAEGELKSPLSLAAKYADKEIFRDLLRATVDQVKKFTPYDYDADPLSIKRWASVHSPKDVQGLADQIESLRGPLLCCEDISGTSYFYRSVIDGSLGDKLVNGNEDLIEWLKSLDISTAVSDDFESSPLYAVASQATVHTYYELNNFFSPSNKATFFTMKMHEVYKKMEEQFLLSRTSKDFDQYLLEALKAGHNTGYDMFHTALLAGSLKWVEQLIAAGLNRQQAFADSFTYISMLADLDPQGLSEKLKGLNYKITQLTVDHARTEAGKQALRALISDTDSHS